MKYSVTLKYYKTGSGYSHEETYETGNCTEPFDAAEWAEEAEIKPETEEDWIVVEARFYEDNADPMFDDPIAETDAKVLE